MKMEFKLNVNSKKWSNINKGVTYTAKIGTTHSRYSKVIFSIDIYPVEKPVDPSRHIGYWNINIEIPPEGIALSIDFLYPEVKFRIGKENRLPDNKWVGTFRETGMYDVKFVLYNPDDGKPIQVKNMRHILIFDDDDSKICLMEHWPGKDRRDPSKEIPDFITQNSIATIIRGFSSKLDEKLKILDIGCGNKPFYPFFFHKSELYLGTDIAVSDSVDIISYGEHLPFHNESFDLLLCTQVLEHVKNPKKAADEMYRVCKKDGVVIASMPFVWEIHDVPKDYWRFAEDGVKLLFNNFESVDLMHNGNSIQSLIQIVNTFINKKSPNTHTKKLIFKVTNNLSLFLEDRINNYGLTPNYTIIAKK